MKLVIKPLLCIACISVLTGCMPNRDVEILQSQVTNQQQTIQSLNAQLSGVQPAQADTWMQLQTLRQEMASMRGTLDNIESALRGVGGSQGLAERFAKQERAFRLIETQLGMNLMLDEAIDLVALGISTTNSPLTSASMPTTNMMGNTAIAGNVTAPMQAGIIPVGNTTQPTVVQNTTTTPAPTPVQSTTTVDTAQALYDNGIKAFNERKYQQALNSFTDFVNTYPKNSLISNAIFWQGESYYQLGNFAAAALAYENVISNHPNSNKAPSSYLKQGMSFSQLDKKDAAKERYQQLIAKYPKAAEATRATQLIKDL